MSRFGDRDSFLAKVNPSRQTYFGKNKERAVIEEFPTLNDICAAYGKTFSAQWLLPQIADLSLFAGVTNINKNQQLELASLIASEYGYLKITEILLFFYNFKMGYYGKFYGRVDPMVITCALRDFLIDRRNIIAKHEQKESERREKENKGNPISWEEYCMKTYGRVLPSVLTKQYQYNNDKD